MSTHYDRYGLALHADDYVRVGSIHDELFRIKHIRFDGVAVIENVLPGGRLGTSSLECRILVKAISNPPAGGPAGWAGDRWSDEVVPGTQLSCGCAADIRKDWEVEAMVAADTFDALVERITRMVSAGRTMVLAVREFTWTHRPPKIYTGLHLAVDARSGGVWVDRSSRDLYCGIVLTSGDRYEDRRRFGFGAEIYQYSVSEVETRAWKHYRDHQAEAPSHSDRRRDVTHVQISGGVPGLKYRSDDSITISAWNRDGVCTEEVLAFDHAPGSW